MTVSRRNDVCLGKNGIVYACRRLSEGGRHAEFPYLDCGSQIDCGGSGRQTIAGHRPGGLARHCGPRRVRFTGTVAVGRRPHQDVHHSGRPHHREPGARARRDRHRHRQQWAYPHHRISDGRGDLGEIATNDGHTVAANVVGYDNETGVRPAAGDLAAQGACPANGQIF